MGKIIDLTTESDHEVLTTTDSGGLLGGQYLHGQPLQSYLDENEVPKYVLRNKKSGLTIQRANQDEQIEADDEYQTLALVTDLRILFVAGKHGGDTAVSLSLADIFESRVESGLRSSTLTIETLSDETWVFPCRGNPSQVVTYINDAAQIWANAARLLDESEDALTTVREDLTDGNLNEVANQIEQLEETIGTARHRISELGPAATARIGSRASNIADELTEIRREAIAREAAREHARAQTLWKRSEYQQAASAYQAAIDTYTAALDTDGSVPDQSTLEARLRGAVGERELLRVGPLVDADSKRRRARALADPQEAATEWEQAHDGYRELLGLDWPTSVGSFVSDRELIRQQTVEIADDAISDHQEAGRRWLTAGDKLAVQDRDHQASQVYERAKNQFEQAHQLAKELRPDRVDEASAGVDAATSRLDGSTPTEQVPEDPITTEPNVDESAKSPDQDRADESDDDTSAADTEIQGIEELSFHDTGTDAVEPDAAQGNEAVGSHSRRSASTPVREDRHESSVLDSIQAQKQAKMGASESGGRPPEQPTEPEAGRSTPPETPHDALSAIDKSQFAELVAAVWEANGWMTTVVAASTDTVYDVVAIRENPEQRLLVWADHWADGEAVSKTTIKQCVATIDSSAGADAGVFVTTGSLTPAAAKLAAENALRVVETDALLEQLRTADLDDRLIELASGKRDESPQA